MNDDDDDDDGAAATTEPAKADDGAALSSDAVEVEVGWLCEPEPRAGSDEGGPARDPSPAELGYFYPEG